jgi:hypothetical protein
MAHNLTDICKATVSTMWDPQYLTILQTSTACYGASFTSLYVDDVRTSQEAHASTACYISLAPRRAEGLY